ncbi:hypothetical protein ACTMSW_26365 [Micromonospora sp. BQ11]|uniref:hypothetical protein n=1 Tax=Micromonospora sp. BQ11 TaxID=3452212 RepID=UPI003F8C43BB
MRGSTRKQGPGLTEPECDDDENKATGSSTRRATTAGKNSAGSFWAATNPERPECGLPLPLYSASKAAATMLTVQYAKSHPGITFNALEPGTTAIPTG